MPTLCDSFEAHFYNICGTLRAVKSSRIYQSKQILFCELQVMQSILKINSFDNSQLRLMQWN